MNSPVLLIAFPLLFSFISAIFKKFEKTSLLIVSTLNILLLFLLEKGVYHVGGWKPPYGINLILDDYSFFGIMIVNLIFAITIMVSFEAIGKYSVVMLISLAALNGMLLTGDLFNLFVFMEVGAISAYILSSMTKKYKGTLNYLILGTLGSGLYLLGTIIFYGIFGSLNMADIHEKIVSSNINTSVLILPTVLIFIGLAVETKLMPFNGWVKGVYSNVNSLVGSIFAAAYSTTMLLVFGRLFITVFLVPDYIKYGFMAVAIFTFALAEFAAFNKKSLRDILLFSSIAQSGLGVTLLLSGLAYPAMLQMVNNVAAKIVLFTIAGILALEAGSDKVDDLRGIFKKHKLLGFGFSAVSLSMIGLPLFYGFYAKLNVLMSLITAENYWLPGLILVVSIVEGAYFVRILTKLWNPGGEGEEANTGSVTELGVKDRMRVSLAVSIIGILLIVTGIFPSIVGDKVKEAAATVQSEIPTYFSNMSGGIN